MVDLPDGLHLRLLGMHLVVVAKAEGNEVLSVPGMTTKVDGDGVVDLLAGHDTPFMLADGVLCQHLMPYPIPIIVLANNISTLFGAVGASSSVVLKGLSAVDTDRASRIAVPVEMILERLHIEAPEAFSSLSVNLLITDLEEGWIYVYVAPSVNVSRAGTWVSLPPSLLWFLDPGGLPFFL